MNDEPKLPGGIASRIPWLKWLLHGLGGGTAVMLGLAALDLLKQRPEFLAQILSGNDLILVGALLVGMVLFDRRAAGFVDLQLRNVIAQERLAANVGALVTKDDERAREQDITLNFLARNSEKILQELKALPCQKQCPQGDPGQ